MSKLKSHDVQALKFGNALFSFPIWCRWKWGQRQGKFFRVVIDTRPGRWIRKCVDSKRKGFDRCRGLRTFQLHLRVASITRAESQRSFPGKLALNVITRLEGNPVIREQDSADSFLLVEQSRRLPGVEERGLQLLRRRSVWSKAGHQVQHVLKWNCDGEKRTGKFCTNPANYSWKNSCGEQFERK